jgi:hypothetical protein
MKRGIEQHGITSAHPPAISLIEIRSPNRRVRAGFLEIQQDPPTAKRTRWQPAAILPAFLEVIGELEMRTEVRGDVNFAVEPIRTVYYRVVPANGTPALLRGGIE